MKQDAMSTGAGDGRNGASGDGTGDRTAVVRTLRAGGDNWIHVAACGGHALVVDPSEADPVLALLEREGWVLEGCLLTHGHSDHTGGVTDLHRRTGCRVAGPRAEGVTGLDEAMEDRQELELAGFRFQLIATPGHTAGHACYFVSDEGWLFTGDHLFYAGCGRPAPGGMDALYRSMARLMDLPGNTEIFCGHDYTEENLRFALTVEPGNPLVESRLHVLREQGVPRRSTLDLERQTNPFLRTNSLEIRRALGMADAMDAEVFAELRQRKNRF